MDIEEIRKQFPLLNQGYIYFDNAATSLTPNCVIEKIIEYYHDYNANVGRGVHKLSQKASLEYENAHDKLASFFNVSEEEIIFVKNSTEGLNTIVSGYPWKKGDNVVNTLIDHHSNYITWLRLNKKSNINIKHVAPDEFGNFSLDDFDKEIDANTRIVSLTHISNGLGSITPVKELTKIAHEKNALVMIDGAQSAPHIPIDLKKLNCDFFVCSGHKMLGPGGTGGLFIKKEIQEDIEPLCIGGGTINDVSLEEYTLKKNYEKYEAGTPNIEGAIGFGKAVEYLNSIGMEKIRKYEKGLISKLLGGMMEYPNIEIFGPKEIDNRSSVVSFNCKGMKPHRMASIFDEVYNIQVRSGHHCCYPLMKYVIKQMQGTLRASLYLYNTEEEINIFLNALNDISRG